jgi:phosphoribosylformimino-5-aminoimidazole carboxamide ribotide isomerase
MWLHMRIVPVLDLMHGVVVRGVGGRRDEYRPIVSQLVASVEPVSVARAFRGHFGFRTLYLADLDAIGGEQPAWTVYEALRQAGFGLWVDAGVSDVGKVRQLAAVGLESIVIGLETLRDAENLAAACHEFGERIVFSLDLKQRQPIAVAPDWRGLTAADIVSRAVDAGVRRLLVLDLAQVGSGSGTGTEVLCRALSAAYPNLNLAAGGGIRGLADLRRLATCGVSTALVASALHDGTLCHEHLAELRSPLDGC